MSAKRVAVALAVAFALMGCAQEEEPPPPGTVTPPWATGTPLPKPEVTLTGQVRHEATIQRGTTGVIATKPKQVSVGVPNVTRDGRTALSVSVDGEPWGDIELRDGEDFEIDGIPFRVETFPQRGEVTVYQLADDDR